MASAILPREIKTWWRHVTPPPNPHERTSALPGTSKRAEVSPPLQSVRASVDGCRASPCTHARSEVAHPGWDYYQEWDKTPDYPRKSASFPLVAPLLIQSLLLERGDRHAAIMSRAPEDVTKITESTYKVSGTEELMREYQHLTGVVRRYSGCNFVVWVYFFLVLFF